MKKTKDTDYLFLSAYIHAREMHLDEGEVDKAAVFDELENMAPDKQIVDFFRLKYDYHNAKVLIKCTCAGINGERLLSPLGRVNIAKLKASYLEKNFKELPLEFSGAMQEAEDTLSRTGDPRLADFVLDKAYISELLHTAQATKSKFLTDYCRLMADSINLRAAVRMMKSGVAYDKLGYVLTDCGSVSPSAVCAAYPEAQSVLKLYEGTLLAPVLPEAEKAAKGEGFSAFEQQCRAVLDAYMSAAKLRCFGELPLIRYLYEIERIGS